MNTATLAQLCDQVRPELACLGEAGTSLVAVLNRVESAGRDHSLEVLDDPGFALDVLIAAGPETEAALVGRVLEFLRVRSNASASGPTSVTLRPKVCVAEAVATFEAGPLATQADGTRCTYRTWIRRLAVARPDDDPDRVTTGDLRDLIAHHVLARREGSTRRLVGNDGAEAAVAAYRAMWRYFVQKGWAARNVAMELDKPPRPDPNRREIRREEATLVRHLAVSTSRDPLLDEVTLSVPERLGVRQIELLRFELCDLDLDERQILVWGKNNKKRTLPIPAALAVLLERYIDDRRPTNMRMADWLASHERLLRQRPTQRSPLGRPSGRRRINDLYERLHRLAPQVFDQGDVVMHSYRHAVGTYVDGHFGRTVAKAILGHKSRRDATDAYLHVSFDKKRKALQSYEDHVLAIEPASWDHHR